MRTAIVAADPVNGGTIVNALDIVVPLHCARSHRGVRGFTLIELIVVIAIVAILVGIAVPTYQDAVRKSRRGQAKADLVELAQRAERWFTVNNSYAGFWTQVEIDGLDISPRDGNGPFYALDRDGGDGAANEFLLTATPIAGTGQEKDTRCMMLTLNSAGAKGIDGGTGTAQDCW